MIQACLNGNRQPGEHPELPVTPEQLGRDARATVAVGATSLHVHPRAESGAETLEPVAVAAAVHAIRVAAPRTELLSRPACGSPATIRPPACGRSPAGPSGRISARSTSPSPAGMS